MKRLFAALCFTAVAGSSFGAQKPITIKGSDTMVIMNAKLAEAYMAKNPGISIQVTGGGSGVGIAALINGTTEIAASSRPMKGSEVEKLKTRFASRGFGVPIARDGLAVYVHQSNPVQQLTLQQLMDIYTGKVTNWSQVGGNNTTIILYSRENSSGTYTYFKDNVLKGKDFSSRAQTLQGTAAVVNAVSKDVHGIGYGGAAYAKGVRFVRVRKDANSPGYLPTLESIKAGDYPITRFLFVYLRKSPSGNTRKFLEWARSPEGQAIVSKVGYFPIK